MSLSVPGERRFIGSQSNNRTDQESMESIERGLGEKCHLHLHYRPVNKLNHFLVFFPNWDFSQIFSAVYIYDWFCILVCCTALPFLNEFSYQNRNLGILNKLWRIQRLILNCERTRAIGKSAQDSQKKDYRAEERSSEAPLGGGPRNAHFAVNGPTKKSAHRARARMCSQNPLVTHILILFKNRAETIPFDI